MPQLPVISGKDFIKFLQILGFIVVRIHGRAFLTHVYKY